MRLHRLVETFDEKASRCRILSELSELMAAVVLELGFERFAMVHGLWFRLPRARLVRLDNYGDFAERFIARQYYLYDPVMLASQRTNRAFTWSEVPGLVPMARRQQDILRDAQSFGLCNGFTVPISVVGEPPGSCSFVTPRDELPSRWHCRAAALVAASAFHAARNLCGYPARVLAISTISPRKLEILRFAAIGKTDPEIAMILGLSRTTIETYMAQLRRALDVYSRTQLCVTAVRFGLIAFEDAISGF